MAFVSNNQEDEDKKAGSQGPVTPGGASNTVQLNPDSGVGGAGSPTTGAAPAAGGQFASLDKYVNANQGAAPGLSGKITSGINDQFNTLQGQNTSTLGGIKDSVNSSYTKQNQAILDQEAANPVSFSGDTNNVKAFQGQLNNKYTGPESAEGDSRYQNQLANVTNAISTGQNQVKTEAGRSNLLRNTEAKPTAGVTALNSAILSKDPNSQLAIESAYNPFQSLVTGLQTGAGDVNSAIGTGKSEAQASSAQANKQIADQSQALNTGINTGVTNAQNSVNQYNENLAQNQNQSSGMDAALRGFYAKTGFTGANPVKELLSVTPSQATPTSATVATADQYATDKALQQLLGTNYNPILNQADVGSAGTFQTPHNAVSNLGDLSMQTGKAAYQAYKDAINKPGHSTVDHGEAAAFTALLKYLQQSNPNVGKIGPNGYSYTFDA